MRVLNCPNCGADLVNSGSEFLYCPYCGAKIDTVDQRIVIHKVQEDVARVREAEVQLQEIKTRHEREMFDRKHLPWNVSVGIIALILLICLLIAVNIRDSIRQKNYVEQSIAAGKILAGDYRDYIGMNYAAAEETLKTHGFRNITLIDLDDASFFSKDRKKDTVAYICIGNNDSFDSSVYFSPTEKVIIQYH